MTTGVKCGPLLLIYFTWIELTMFVIYDGSIFELDFVSKLFLGH